MDDYIGSCGVRYPLMTAVLQGLHAYDRYKLLRQQYDLYTTKPPLTTQQIYIAEETLRSQQTRVWKAPVTKSWRAPVTQSHPQPVANNPWYKPGRHGWNGQQTTTPVTTKAPFFW